MIDVEIWVDDEFIGAEKSNSASLRQMNHDEIRRILGIDESINLLTWVNGHVMTVETREGVAMGQLRFVPSLIGEAWL